MQLVGELLQSVQVSIQILDEEAYIPLSFACTQCNPAFIILFSFVRVTWLKDTYLTDAKFVVESILQLVALQIDCTKLLATSCLFKFSCEYWCSCLIRMVYQHCIQKLPVSKLFCSSFTILSRFACIDCASTTRLIRVSSCLWSAWQVIFGVLNQSLTCSNGNWKSFCNAHPVESGRAILRHMSHAPSLTFDCNWLLIVACSR